MCWKNYTRSVPGWVAKACIGWLHINMSCVNSQHTWQSAVGLEWHAYTVAVHNKWCSLSLWTAAAVTAQQLMPSAHN